MHKTSLLVVVLLSACSEDAGLRQVKHSLDVMVSGDGSVTLTPPDRSCTESCQEIYLDRTVVTLEATPDEHAEFVEWTGDCASERAPSCLVLTDRPRSVGATFYPATGSVPQITVLLAGSGDGRVTSQPMGVDCPGACRSEFERDAMVTLTATADGSSEFAGWSGDCAFASGPECTLTVDRSKNVSARFDPVTPPATFTVDVDLRGSGLGAVVATPGDVRCDDDCELPFPEGTNVTFQVTPEAGSLFVGWTGDCSGAADCVLTVDADRAITATFEPEGADQAELSVVFAGGGGGLVRSDLPGIDCTSDCTASFALGTVVTLTAEPDLDATFSGFGGACSGNNCAVTLDADSSVTVTFLQEAPTIPPPLDWPKRFGAGGIDIGRAIAVDSTGAVYVTGHFVRAVDFGGGPLRSNNNSRDVFLVKYTAAGDFA